MPRITIFILLILFAVDAKADPVRQDVESKTGVHWIIETDTVSVNGDPADLASEARQNWKIACKKWKQEFREDNKDSKIISLDCGSPVCSGDAGDKSCSSRAKYKIKTMEDQDE